MHKLLVISSFLFSLTYISSHSWANEIYLDCTIIKGSTGTNILEVIISNKEVCMGDTSMSPECAKVDGSIPKRKKNTGMYATVNVTENEYNYMRFFGNTIGRIISLNRLTGRAIHTQLDDAMNQDVSVFQCKKIIQKKKF